MLTLRPLTPADAAAIKSWPRYPEEFHELDYALRNDGWLDHYVPGGSSDIFIGEDDGDPVGFSILTQNDGRCPEFRIAIHPEKLGKGYGRTLTRLTLAHGFSRTNCSCIRLIVRKNNERAQKLYEELRFQRTGECIEDVQGKPVAFYRMELSRDRFYGVDQ